jgi:PIN domain nuclease of toxin-antitoxin system
MIVLDTHAWLWWVSEPGKLGRAAAEALAVATRIGIPAICCLEVAAAVSLRRISLDRDVGDWLDAALSLPKTVLLPLTPRVAVRATTLEAFHGDPADRLIVATALIEGCPVVTKDRRIRRHMAVTSIW